MERCSHVARSGVVLATTPHVRTRREVGGDSDTWARAVSSSGKEGAATVAWPSWAGPGGSGGGKGETERASGRGKLGQRRELGQQGNGQQARNEAVKEKSISFSFSKQIFQFQFKFQFSLKFLINTKHSRNNMQRHECTYMLLLYDKF